MVTFTKEILNGKLHFLLSITRESSNIRFTEHKIKSQIAKVELSKG